MTIKEIKEELRKARREVRVLERELKKAKGDRAVELAMLLNNNVGKTIVIELDPKYADYNHIFQKGKADDCFIINLEGDWCFRMKNCFTCDVIFVKNIYIAYE